MNRFLAAKQWYRECSTVGRLEKSAEVAVSAANVGTPPFLGKSIRGPKLLFSFYFESLDLAQETGVVLNLNQLQKSWV